MNDKKKSMKRINWKEFISQHNMKWDELCYRGGYYSSNDRKHGLKRRYRKEWEEGAFIGNGMMGAMIYKESHQILRWELGRNDVVAHNFLEGIDWAVPRVPIGDIVMIPSQKIIKETMKLSLWDAEVTGVIDTEKGVIKWRSFNHAQKDVIVIEVNASCKENDIIFGFRPKHGISPRIQYAKKKPSLNSLPPEPLQFIKDNINLSVQAFVKKQGDNIYSDEGECAVAWKETQKSETYKIFYLSITNSQYDNSARNKAIGNIKDAIDYDINQYADTHRKWWHEYYPASYVSLSDKKWERFYWIQMYKLACAMKEDGVVLDSQGPWMTTTPWPTTVWNLNVQLSYMSVYTSNRYQLGCSLINTLIDNKDILIENAKPIGIQDGMYVSRATNPINLHCPWPDTRELGNLTWALHNVWRHYRMTMDEEILKNFLFPFLKANINSFLHLMYMGDDGKYHIPDTSSPEYPSVSNVNNYPIADCNYTLSLFKWGCKILVEIDKKLNLNDPLNEKWKDVIANLIDYPTDKNGYMVGADVPFSKSHRHYSHLFMIYPLHEMDMNKLKDYRLMKKSIEHWVGFKGALQGYTYTGAAAMAAYMNDGNKALEYLNGLDAYLCPNTMYAEKGPVIETPLSAAESIHYMLLQSWGDTIQVFPAVPDVWDDIEFHNLLAEGGFEISARRKNGKTEYVHIKSLVGSPLRIKPGIDGKVKYTGASETYFIKEVEKETYIIELQKGESIMLYFSI